MKFHIGCDPELFLQDAAGALVSAIGKIGGSKEHPRPIPSLGEGFAVQEDNVAVEFNTPPADSEEQFVDCVNKMMNYLLLEVNNMGLTFNKESAAFFPYNQLTDLKAMVFGCDPDYNAWKGGISNPKPDKDVDMRLRSAGGHVHVGCKMNGSRASRMDLIKFMDLYLGVPSVLMDNGELRKKLYGQAGAFRSKAYGVEYRTLSNYWVFDDNLIKWVYRNTAKAVTQWDEQIFHPDAWSAQIQDAINNNNKDQARWLVDHFGLEVIEHAGHAHSS